MGLSSRRTWSQGTPPPAVLNQSGLVDKRSVVAWLTAAQRAACCDSGAVRRKLAKWAYSAERSTSAGTTSVASPPRLVKVTTASPLKWPENGRISADRSRLGESTSTNSTGSSVQAVVSGGHSHRNALFGCAASARENSMANLSCCHSSSIWAHVIRFSAAGRMSVVI